MTNALSETSITAKLAEEIAATITRRVVAALRRMPSTLLDDSTLLRTVWDEVCVQIQGDHSPHWHAYELTMQTFVADIVRDLSQHARDALWLQTDEGGDWDCERPEEREPKPVFSADIVAYLMRDHIYAEAARYTNARIRAFLDRSTLRD